MNTPHGRPGLTIPQMLITITAVGLVVGILFPLWQPPQGGCRTSCISHLKQIGLASAMYMQDYDDTLFWNPDPGGVSTQVAGHGSKAGTCAPQPRDSFVLMLLPYIKNTSVFQCPSSTGYDLSRHLGYATGLARAANCYGASDPDWVNHIGYGFNEVLISGPCGAQSLASLKHPAAEVALLADAERPWASTTNTWAQTNVKWSRYWAWDPLEQLRHCQGNEKERGQYFVFADGHAKYLRPELLNGDHGSGKQGYFPDALLE